MKIERNISTKLPIPQHHTFLPGLEASKVSNLTLTKAILINKINYRTAIFTNMRSISILITLCVSLAMALPAAEPKANAPEVNERDVSGRDVLEPLNCCL